MGCIHLFISVTQTAAVKASPGRDFCSSEHPFSRKHRATHSCPPQLLLLLFLASLVTLLCASMPCFYCSFTAGFSFAVLVSSVPSDCLLGRAQCVTTRYSGFIVVHVKRCSEPEALARPVLWWTKAWTMLGFLQLSLCSLLLEKLNFPCPCPNRSPLCKRAWVGETNVQGGKAGRFIGVEAGQDCQAAGGVTSCPAAEAEGLVGDEHGVQKTPALCAGVKCWEGTTIFLGIFSQCKHITTFLGRLSKCIDFDCSILPFFFGKSS